MKTFFIICFFGFISCTNSQTYILKSNKHLPDVYFNVVEKKLDVDDQIPVNLENMINDWFNYKIKVDGYEGIVEILFNDYSQIITNFNNGKKIELSLNFLVKIENSKSSTKKNINGVIKSFASIEGNFSLNDVDALIIESQFELLSQLSKKLNN